jgi:hypothetical protein
VKLEYPSSQEETTNAVIAERKMMDFEKILRFISTL